MMARHINKVTSFFLSGKDDKMAFPSFQTASSKASEKRREIFSGFDNRRSRIIN